MRDEEKLKEDDSPTAKKPKFERFPLTKWELAAALGIFLLCSTGLLCVYLTMPSAEYQSVKLPRTLSDLRVLKYVLFSSASFRLGNILRHFASPPLVPFSIFEISVEGCFFHHFFLLSERRGDGMVLLKSLLCIEGSRFPNGYGDPEGGTVYCRVSICPLESVLD